MVELKYYLETNGYDFVVERLPGDFIYVKLDTSYIGYEAIGIVANENKFSAMVIKDGKLTFRFLK